MVAKTDTLVKIFNQTSIRGIRNAGAVEGVFGVCDACWSDGRLFSSDFARRHGSALQGGCWNAALYL